MPHADAMFDEQALTPVRQGTVHMLLREVRAIIDERVY
jgi:hypothetical protein